MQVSQRRVLVQRDDETALTRAILDLATGYRAEVNSALV